MSCRFARRTLLFQNYTAFPTGTVRWLDGPERPDSRSSGFTFGGGISGVKRASHPLLRGLYRLLVSLSFLLLLFQPFLYPFWSCMRTLREDDFLFPSKASFVLLLPRYFYFFFAFFLLPRFPRFNTIFPGQQGHIKASSFSLVARSLLSFSRRRCEGTRGGAAREDAVDDDGLIGATD